MTRARVVISIIAAAMVAGLLTVTGLVYLQPERAWGPVEVTGVVLRDDVDPKNQVPLADTLIVARNGRVSVSTRSDANGYFQVTLGSIWRPHHNVTLTFQRDQYEPLQLTDSASGPICVARMKPAARLRTVMAGHGGVKISDVRVRYSVRATNTALWGSAAKVFEAENKGGVPCNNQPPCSPDGKWKATLNTQRFDAGAGNQFRNTRVACIAGPCPFTKLATSDLTDGGEWLNVSVLNWSDTATFLLESEVTHSVMSNMVRVMYPAILGPELSFTLPASAEGPSILADLNGAEIVFPLGPELRLSWAACSLTGGQDSSKQFRCELKPGYEF